MSKEYRYELVETCSEFDKDCKEIACAVVFDKELGYIFVREFRLELIKKY